MTSLEASYAWCRQIARNRAKNFYYSFLLLDKPRRDALCAIYAFMRLCDDLSDEPGERSDAVFDHWRSEMQEALGGKFSTHQLWPAFADTVHRYRIPERYFHDMIDGVHSDLHFQPIETFDQLYQYCYRVASVVGLTIIHILGFQSPQALPLAEKCGVAFQLTNVIRDVREDYERGRIYLPLEDRRRYSVEEAMIAAAETPPALRNLLAFEAARARALYRESRPLLHLVDPPGRPMLGALMETYSSLLDRIEACNYEVLRQRIELSRARKLLILAKHAASKWIE
ncbi:MAG: phytoene/squalene synthase family protein [Bryobacteraceae bacterium]|nr:phytoene/squalene synthase family protein [Bryobacteraceae bacterium]MDW8377048.1 phytoene/squalene synthase family protein [Bryobacterales bacterium]